MDFIVYPSRRFGSLIYPLVGFPRFPMLILFIIYFRINFDIVVVNYTNDRSLELGSEMSGLVLHYGKV